MDPSKAIIKTSDPLGDVTINDPDKGYLPVAINNAPARITAHASAAEVASGNSGAIDVSLYSELLIALNITAVSGTTPSLTLTVDVSDDGGTTWYTGPSFAAQTAAGLNALAIGRGASGTAGSITTAGIAFGDTIRLRWTISGTTPSFTFTAKIVGK